MKQVRKTKTTKPVVDKVGATLAQRQATHGSFEDFAKVENALLEAVQAGKNWDSLDDVIKSAIRMNQHKIARILVGNPYELDHYVDAQGYMRLGEIYVAKKGE